MRGLIFRFAEDETGATAIEYGLIGGLIAIGIITGVGLLGNNINQKFKAIATKTGTAMGTN